MLYNTVSVKLCYTVSVVFTDCIQVLEAEDIASAILYTLSTPSRMQVSSQIGDYAGSQCIIDSRLNLV